MKPAPKRKDAFEDLAELLAALGRSATKRDLRWLGGYLGRLDGRPSGYSYEYLRGTLRGTQRPGLRLRRTVVSALAIAEEGVHPVQATHRDQPVLVPPGLDVAGAQIGIAARDCATPGCPIRFISNAPARRRCYHCSPYKGRRSI